MSEYNLLSKFVTKQDGEAVVMTAANQPYRSAFSGNPDNDYIVDINDNDDLMYDVYVYHDKCMDGLVAMAVAAQLPINHSRTFTTVAATHGTEIKLDTFVDRSVCFLDYSVGKDRMLEILEVANKVTVIDHHISVHKELSEIDHPNFKYVYDIRRSGAQLAWAHFIGTVEPYFIELIGDRDIWTKKYKEADILNLALRVTNLCLGQMSIFISDLIEFRNKNDDTSVYPETYEFIRQGHEYNTYHKHIVNQIAENAYEASLDDGTLVYKVNCPGGFASDVGDRLANRSPSGVAWMYSDVPGKRVNSLRVSATSEYDASVYAKSKGGGGHIKACGWTEDNNDVNTVIKIKL